ncbi:hypothetical protein AOLI_G00212510 [Acnodon oligacanthus]
MTLTELQSSSEKLRGAVSPKSQECKVLKGHLQHLLHGVVDTVYGVIHAGALRSPQRHRARPICMPQQLRYSQPIRKTGQEGLTFIFHPDWRRLESQETEVESVWAHLLAF